MTIAYIVVLWDYERGLCALSCGETTNYHYLPVFDRAHTGQLNPLQMPLTGVNYILPI